MNFLQAAAHAMLPALLCSIALLAGAAPAAQAQTAESAPTRAPVRPPQRALDRIAAVVNDEAITYDELATQVRAAEEQLRRQNIPLPASDVLRRQVLERLITDRAQLQLARETGVRVDDGTVNAAMTRIAERNQMTLPAFRERLQNEGVPFTRFRDDVRDEIVLSRLRDREVDSRIQISEGEIDNFLAEKAGAAASAVEYNLAQILLRAPDNATPDRIEETRQRALDLMAQLRGGADFARTAAGYSNAPEALQGGDLGWRTADRLPGVFVEAIKGLKPGELAPLVRSPGGFHILKLVGARNEAEAKSAKAPVEQTHVRHILLRVSELTPEADVKRRLADLRDRVVRTGQDFGQLARMYSVDGSATRGGDLGWMYPGDTVPDFESAMNALKPGEVSEPVQSPFGWHLIQVLERRTAVAADFDRITARMALRERKSEEAYQEWLRQLRDRTYVELRLDES
jgi:peptidyl-prolyl cis-trans isomerase SurA